MWKINNEPYLAHHGIKGQKWGIRRYQNPDGSLTEEGKRRYSEMSQQELADFLYKEKKLQLREMSGGKLKRAWKGGPEYLGENSQKVYEKYVKDKRDFEKSKEYKEYTKQYNKLTNDLFDGKITDEEWSKKQSEIYDKLLTKNSYTEGNFIGGIVGQGKIYSKKYIENYGKSINVAELQDLGYDLESAKWITEKLLDTSNMQYDKKTDTYRTKTNLRVGYGNYRGDL